MLMAFIHNVKERKRTKLCKDVREKDVIIWP